MAHFTSIVLAIISVTFNLNPFTLNKYISAQLCMTHAWILNAFSTHKYNSSPFDVELERLDEEWRDTERTTPSPSCSLVSTQGTQLLSLGTAATCCLPCRNILLQRKHTWKSPGPRHRGRARTHRHKRKVQSQFFRPTGNNFTKSFRSRQGLALADSSKDSEVRGAGESCTLPGKAEVAAAIVYFFLRYS